MADVDFKRGDLVRYCGKVYKVRNVRTDRHRDGVYTTAKIVRKDEVCFCAPVEHLELVKRGEAEP